MRPPGRAAMRCAYGGRRKESDVRDEGEMFVLRAARANGGAVPPGSHERAVQELFRDGYIDASGRITGRACELLDWEDR